jgi:putative hydrolase of the HAD superfamily
VVISSTVRAVFFDAVGTLLFPEPSAPEVYAAAAARQGLNIPLDTARRRFLYAYRAEEEVDHLAEWVTSEAREVSRWRRIVATTLAGVENPNACFRELFEHFAQPGAWRIHPATQRIFTNLCDRGFTLGLGSNYDSRLLSVLAGFPEFASLSDRVVISATVGHRKPAREFFREVVRVAGCKAEEVMFVGDDFENDYLGAMAAGLLGLHLDCGGNKAKATRRIATLDQLIE